jgi:MFS family permease
VLRSKPVTPTLSAKAADVDAGVIQEVVKNYYAAAVASADAARTRAQNGYTIASAIAAAIVAAGVFGGIADARPGVKVIGICALLAWFLVAALFMYAVAGNVSGLETGEQPNGSSFVRVVFKNIREVRGIVNARSQAAQVVMVIAFVLTIVGISIALFYPPSSKVEGTISLSLKGAKEVRSLCGASTPKKLQGTYSPGDLEDKFLSVDLVGRVCNGSSTLRIRRSGILAVSG